MPERKISMIVSAHQPSYFPWLGLLHKIKQSDLFILMDEVQLADRAYQHRNIFLTANGEEKYLTIPIKKKGYREKMLKDIELSEEENWQDKHRQFLLFNYKKHPYHEEIMQSISFFFEKPYKTLGEVLHDAVQISMDLFGIKTKIVLQSSLEYDRSQKKSDLILELIKSTKANMYLSGQGAKEYMVLDDYAANNIEVRFQDFVHPQYWQLQQKKGDEFKPGLASLDVLFNTGTDAASKLLQV